MESQQAGNEDHYHQGGGKGAGTNSNSSSFLCRQSSTRWTPTTDQIRILKELYYNNGVRSPTAEQIQRISAKLRQYGKIEGKNVFYWFQNHKARERQKKRFTAAPDQFSTTTIPNVQCYTRPPPPPHHASSAYLWKNNNNNEFDHHTVPSPMYSKLSAGGGSSGGLLNGGSMCNYGCASVAMEKSFRECSITSAGGNFNGTGGSMGQNITWVGVNEYAYNNSYPNFHDKRKYMVNYEDQTLEMEDDPEEEDEDSTSRAIETLPLFPMHGEIKHQSTSPEYFNGNFGSSNGWYINDTVKQAAYSPRASLELTLNSCFANLNN